MRSIYANDWAFAALRADGSVVAWGRKEAGGDASEVQHQLVDVGDIYATLAAFAAFKADGTVVAWGQGPEIDEDGNDLDAGGDCSKVQGQLVDVLDISASNHAFGALRANGSIVCWGNGDEFREIRQKAAP